MKQGSVVAFGLIPKYPKLNRILFRGIYICGKHRSQENDEHKFRLVVTLIGKLGLQRGTQELQKHWQYSGSRARVVGVVSTWVYVHYYFLRPICECVGYLFFCIMKHSIIKINKRARIATWVPWQPAVSRMLFPHLRRQLCAQQREPTMTAIH